MGGTSPYLSTWGGGISRPSYAKSAGRRSWNITAPIGMNRWRGCGSATRPCGCGHLVKSWGGRGEAMTNSLLKNYGEKCCPTCTRVLPLARFGRGRLRECDDCRAMRGTPATKRCGRCGEEKPAAQFGRSSSSMSGLSCYCKGCIRVANEEWRTAHPDAYRASMNKAYAKRRQVNISNPRTPPESKRCPCCGVDKLATEYYAAKDSSTGLSAHCKACIKVQRRAHYEKNRERIREYERVRRAAGLKKSKPQRYYRLRRKLLVIRQVLEKQS